MFFEVGSYEVYIYSRSVPDTQTSSFCNYALVSVGHPGADGDHEDQ